MSKFTRVILFCMMVLLLGKPMLSAQEEALTLEQLRANIQQACEEIDDLSMTVITKYERMPEAVAMYKYKRPYKTLTTMMDGKFSFLMEKEGDKFFTSSYFPESKEIRKLDLKLEEIKEFKEIESESEFVPIFGQILFSIRSAINNEVPWTLEKVKTDEGVFWKFVIEDEIINKMTKTVFYIKNTDWFVSKIESFQGGQLLISQKVTDVVINSGLKDEDFNLGAPTDTKVVDEVYSKVTSVEVVNVGRVTPETVVNVKKDQCGGCRKSSVSCGLKLSEGVERTQTIPAVLRTGFGFSYKPQFDSEGEFAMVKTKYIYPPMTNPNTGEIKTEEELMAFVKPGEDNIIGWNFDFERELVQGEWTLQVLDYMGENVLAERKFNVVAADDIYKYRKKWGKKIKQAKEHIKKNPKDAMAVKDLGNIYLTLRDYDQAIAYYKQANAITPHSNFYNNLCLASNDKGEYNKAIEYCNEALKMSPRHTSAFINRGNAYRLKGEYDKAIADFNESLKVVPKHDRYNPPFAYYNRGLTHMELKEYNKAVADFTKKIEYNPDDHSAYFWRSKAYKALGDEENFKKDQDFLKN